MGGGGAAGAHEDDRLADGHAGDGGKVPVVLLVLVLAADDPHCGSEGVPRGSKRRGRAGAEREHVLRSR